MNPFGFALRWLDRRIARVAAEQRRAIEVEAATRAAADAALSGRLDALIQRDREAARVAAARDRIDATCDRIAATPSLITSA